MKSYKEQWQEIRDDLYEQAIEDGMAEEDAIHHADAQASIEAQDRLEAAGDAAYEQWKDEGMER